jgi:hypothetical protein
VTDPRLLRPALDAARKALRLLDEEHVPVGLRRVVAASGRRLPAPLERTLIDHLERLDWLRTEALGHLDDGHTASRLFLERPDGWEETAAGLEAVRGDATAERLLQSSEAVNARLLAKVAGQTEGLRAARAEIERLRLESRSDPERTRLVESNRDLRDRMASAERAVLAEARRSDELERLLGEADRRIAELRRRSRVGQREAPAPGAPQVFGAGDPLALARSLDHLLETLARRSGPERLDVKGPAAETFVLPQGVRPDQAEAVEWFLSLPRPVVVLIDGYNVGHELASVPDSGVRLRVEQMASRMRRMAEAPMTVVVFWDSRTDTDGWRSGGVDVRYVPSADEAIVEQSGRGVVVVSSDRAVREAAERKGAVGLWSQALLAWMAR